MQNGYKTVRYVGWQVDVVAEVCSLHGLIVPFSNPVSVCLIVG